MRREVCGCCASSGSLDTVLDLGTAPLADEFPTTPNPDQARYPLQLMACHACGLGQLSEIVDDELLWGGDYAFYSGSSATIREYSRRYARWLAQRYGLLMRRGYALEIACNDGTLMSLLEADGYQTLGIDPATGPAEAARARGLRVLNQPFDTHTGRTLVDGWGQPSLLIANNVAAHVADLDDFFSAIQLVLAPHGAAIIEVQYLPDLLVGNDFPLLYHEHRYYYSLTAMTRIARKHDLTVIDAWLTEPQGGSLRVDLRHAEAPGHPALSVGQILFGEKGWLTDGGVAFRGLQGRADRIRASLLQMVHAERQARRVVAGYGASAKASTLLAWTGLDQEPLLPEDSPGAWPGSSGCLPWVVDTTPSKIGRFMPGTSIPVVGRRDGPDAGAGPDTYLVMIYNYLGHVVRQEAEWLGHGDHRMILPLPKPVLL